MNTRAPSWRLDVAAAGPSVERKVDSEILGRALFDLSPDALVLIEDERCIDCNQAALRILAIDGKEALLGAHCGRLSPAAQPDGRESITALRTYFSECHRAGAVSFNWTCARHSGQEFPAEVRLQSLDGAGAALLLASIRDVSDLQAMAAEARARNDYLATVLENSPAAILIAHLGTSRIRLANRSARHMLRAADNALDAVSVQDLWAEPDERVRFLEKFKRDGIASGEVRLRRLDGQLFYAYLHWQYNPGNSDEILCWSLDCTEQQQTRSLLDFQGRLLQQIIDHLPVALFVKDVTDGFRYQLFNQKGAELVEGQIAAIIGRTDFEIFPTRVARRYRVEDLEIVASGKPLIINEDQIETAHGNLVYARTIKIAIPDEQGHTRLIVGMSEDITEQREIEQALRSSERRFRELAEHAPVGIIMTDQRGNCIYINQQWQSLNGMDQNLAAGVGWQAAIHPEDRARVVAKWNKFVERGVPFTQEYRLVRNEAEVVWVSGKAVPIRNEAEQAVGFLGTATDITEHKLFEARLQASRNEARRANQAKSEFLSRMSHELRTPLNAILGFGQLLQMDAGNLSTSQKEGIDYILAGGEHLLELIDDVLDYSRIESDHVDLNIGRIELNEVLGRAVTMVSAMAREAGVSIDAPPAASLPDPMADPRRLQQVLTNFLSNAIKYNHPGGSVQVFQQQLDDGMLRIAVQDNGRGIRQQDAARLFEPFERIVNQDDAIEGTGIGLSICKRLAEFMGGRVGFRSEFGSGSTFWIDLAVASDRQ